MIIPILIVLLAGGLIAGGADSSSATGATETGGAGVSQGEASGSLTSASEVGKKKPKIEFSGAPEPNDLQATDLVVGTGAEATPGTEVTVHYIVLLNKNGKEIESSWGGKPYSFEIGSGEVAAGWEQGIAGMKEGGRRELVAPSEFAYGKAGSPPLVGPDEALHYVIDLLKVKSASDSGQASPPQG